MTSVTPDPDSVGALEPEPSVSLADSSLYFNRELSWIDFNDRVLQLTEDDAVWRLAGEPSAVTAAPRAGDR